MPHTLSDRKKRDDTVAIYSFRTRKSMLGSYQALLLAFRYRLRFAFLIPQDSGILLRASAKGT